VRRWGAAAYWMFARKPAAQVVVAPPPDKGGDAARDKDAPEKKDKDAGANKDKPKPPDQPITVGYKTPREVFDANNAAGKKNDFRGQFECLTPESQKVVALTAVAEAIAKRRELRSLDEKNKFAAQFFAPMLAVLDKHGLTEEATRTITLALGTKGRAETRRQLEPLVKDYARIWVDFAEAIVKLGGGGQNNEPPPDVQFTAGRAEDRRGEGLGDLCLDHTRPGDAAPNRVRSHRQGVAHLQA